MLTDSNEISEVSSLIQSKAHELLQNLFSFDIQKRNFIELELTLCDELNKLGAQVLEQAIPLIYGDGYKGSKVEVDEEHSYSCLAKKRERSLLTAFGKINLQRAVYTEYHSGGIKSFLDERLDIENKRHCPLRRYWSDLLGTVAPFGEAGDILNKIRGINISTKQVEIWTEDVAQKITKHHEEQIKDIVLDEKGVVPAAKINFDLNAKRTVYLETDGCHINTNNGWKECKTFMLFETEKISDDEYRLKNKFYYSTMKDIGELKRQLKYHLERYCGSDEIRIVCIGDGAKWIWNTCKELFPEEEYPIGIIEIVDYYHALEKIGDIKTEIFTDEESGNRFYKKCEDFLWDGNIEVVEQELLKLKNEQKLGKKKQFIDERLRYFMNNKEKMRYGKFRGGGLCIGSGAIESANKYVVQRRVKLPGMRWNEDNANHMVHLRAEYINGKLDKHYGIETNPLMSMAVT